MPRRIPLRSAFSLLPAGCEWNRLPVISLLILAAPLACKPKAPHKERNAPSPAPPIKSPPSDGESKVDTEVFALDTDQDGEWDLLAVQWSIAKGWHIYWTNPGDSGLATKIVFKKTGHGEFGPVKLPAPSKWVSPTGLVGYGYAQNTALFSHRLDQSEQQGPITLKLTWLVCKDACLRGSKTLQWTPPAKPDSWTPTLKNAYARVPQDTNALKTRHRWEIGAHHLHTLEVKFQQGEVTEFFPFETQTPLTDSALESNTLRLSYRNANRATHLDAPQGVVGLRTGDTLRYFRLNLPWPTTKR